MSVMCIMYEILHLIQLIDNYIALQETLSQILYVDSFVVHLFLNQNGCLQVQNQLSKQQVHLDIVSVQQVNLQYSVCY